MGEQVEKGQASLYVDVTCPICQEDVALSNTFEISKGIRYCRRCLHLSREAKLEILIHQLLMNMRKPESPKGRFYQQVERATAKSNIIDKLRTINIQIGNLYHLRHRENHDNFVEVMKVIEQFLKEIRKEVNEL